MPRVSGNFPRRQQPNPDSCAHTPAVSYVHIPVTCRKQTAGLRTGYRASRALDERRPHVALHLAEKTEQKAAFALEIATCPGVSSFPGTARRPPSARHAHLERRGSLLIQLERLSELDERGALPGPGRQARRLRGVS